MVTSVSSARRLTVLTLAALALAPALGALAPSSAAGFSPVATGELKGPGWGAVRLSVAPHAQLAVTFEVLGAGHDYAVSYVLLNADRSLAFALDAMRIHQESGVIVSAVGTEHEVVAGRGATGRTQISSTTITAAQRDVTMVVWAAGSVSSFKWAVGTVQGTATAIATGIGDDVFLVTPSMPGKGVGVEIDPDTSQNLGASASLGAFAGRSIDVGGVLLARSTPTPRDDDEAAPEERGAWTTPGGERAVFARDFFATSDEDGVHTFEVPAASTARASSDATAPGLWVWGVDVTYILDGL